MLGRKKSIIAYPIALLLGVALIAFLIIGRPQPSERNLAPAPVPIVEVLDVRESMQPLIIYSQGVVSAATKVELVAEVNGRVVRADSAFAPGGQFSTKQILLELDETDYRAALSQAEANVADAKRLLSVEQGTAKQARREWRDLKSEEANALFLREPQIASAKASLEAAKAARDKAKVELLRTKISLPFDGRVLRQEVNQGEYVVAGRSIGEVFALDSAEIRLPLTTSQYYRLGSAIGAEVSVSAKAGDIRREWLGKIIRVESDVDSVSRMHHVVAEIDSAFIGLDGRPPLALGQYVEAKIQTLEEQPVYEIPRSALRQPQNVWLLDSESVLHVTEVDVVLRNDERAFIRLKEDPSRRSESDGTSLDGAFSDSALSDGALFDSNNALRIVTSSLSLAITGMKTIVEEEPQTRLNVE